MCDRFARRLLNLRAVWLGGQVTPGACVLVLGIVAG